MSDDQKIIEGLRLLVRELENEVENKNYWMDEAIRYRDLWRDKVTAEKDLK